MRYQFEITDTGQIDRNAACPHCGIVYSRHLAEGADGGRYTVYLCNGWPVPRTGVEPEPPPVVNDQPCIQDQVIDDLVERKHQGIAKYGTALQPFNGRRPLVDAYQESIDQTQYLKQASIEWDAMVARIATLERLLLDGGNLTAGSESEGVQAWRRQLVEVLATPLKDHVAKHGTPVDQSTQPVDDTPEVLALMAEGRTLTDAVQAILTRRERRAAEAAIAPAIGPQPPSSPPGAGYAAFSASVKAKIAHAAARGLAGVADPQQRTRMVGADVDAWKAAHPVGGEGDREVPCRYCGDGMSEHHLECGVPVCRKQPTRCAACGDFDGDHAKPFDGKACHLRRAGNRVTIRFLNGAEYLDQSDAGRVEWQPASTTSLKGSTIDAPEVVDHAPDVITLKLALATFGRVPEYKSAGAAGLDVCAAIGVARTIEPGQRWRMKVGIHLEIPHGYVGKVEGRSGLFDEHGIIILSGTIDPDYRGEVGALMMNLGTKPVTIEPGQRIAQLLLHRRVRAEIEVVGRGDLSDTVRGERGFGSTGSR